MSQYRYRTSTLIGPWRTSRLQAELDAVTAGQAILDKVGKLRWQVRGSIESSDLGQAGDRLRA